VIHSGPFRQRDLVLSRTSASTVSKGIGVVASRMASDHSAEHRAGYTDSAMTDWPAQWRPVNPLEAQGYLDAHADGSGDLGLMEECQSS